MMISQDFDGAIACASTRMTRELAPELTYHNLAHTFSEVLPAARYLAINSGLKESDVQLVAVGAAFHDIGWVIQGPMHETIGATIARETLPAYGFSPDDIEVISGMILATPHSVNPTNLLEQILVDADLDVLGRADFWQRNAALRTELTTNGTGMTDEVWYRQQLQFLQSHHYYTQRARQLRDEQKCLHIIEFSQRLQRATAANRLA